MRAYLAQISINLKLTSRDKTVLFFNYAFPLVFFFIFGQLFKAQQGSAIVQVVNMVLVIGVLGAGFFGAGMRAIMEREQNILRRFKVAPISAGPILISSLVVGLINYLPSAMLMLALAHFVYGMPWPAAPVSFLVFLSLGALAFRSLGMIIAAVVNSMQESQILIQLLYFPMLFLSGATIPMDVMPEWVKIVAQFLPSTYLFSGLQAILVRGEGLARNWTAVMALALTVALATWLGVKLFRWEKEEKVSGSAKMWVLAVLAPFIVLGVWQAKTRESIGKQKIVDREISRNRTRLIRGARIFIGDGRVIESGGVLIKDGKIAEVYAGNVPDAKTLNAEAVEANGQTVLPGLIDVHVHLGSPGGIYESPGDYTKPHRLERELAAYLYCGVTTVKSDGDELDEMKKLRTLTGSGEWLGARLYFVGPLFTTEGGHGTEFAKYVPANYRQTFNAQFLRMPKTEDEARRMVDALKNDGVDGIKEILEAGQAGMLFQRMAVNLFDAVAQQSHQDGLPVVVHTGDAKDVADALDAKVDGIEHGSFRDQIPEALFERMKAQGTAYDPTLTVGEAFTDLAAGNLEPLQRPLVQQVGPAALLAGTKKMLGGQAGKAGDEGVYKMSLEDARANLLRAWKAGAMLVTGTDSGNILLIHGPALHRELQLWVAAGIPPAVALQAATGNAAKLLRATDRIGLIEKGRDANLLLVDGNPLEDIKRTENIQTIFFQGERIDRQELFDQE